MENQLLTLVKLTLSGFKDIWPYLLLTIPLAVLVKLSGVSKHIKRVMELRPVTAILLATIVGAFSPFCSCGVIPVIATLLISGVPLAPVMAFWIASPSMDPEIFFLSVATLGWNLAVWRLVSTLLISLSAGFITHFVVKKKWLDETNILRSYSAGSPNGLFGYLKPAISFVSAKLSLFIKSVGSSLVTTKDLILNMEEGTQQICCDPLPRAVPAKIKEPAAACTSCGNPGVTNKSIEEKQSSVSPLFLNRLLTETWNAAFLVIKFMALSFLLTALIKLYVPSEWITGLVGTRNSFSVFAAVIIGIPFYTSSLAALPLVGGLLSQGMSSAAALAFLIAGPTTTLPAMAAVWGLTTRRVFLLYLSFSLIGALVMGYVYLFAGSF